MPPPRCGGATACCMRFGLHIAGCGHRGDPRSHGVNAAARLQAAAERGAAGFLSTEAVEIKTALRSPLMGGAVRSCAAG